jgi:transcriptional regulator with XRE-family HTH domain
LVRLREKLEKLMLHRGLTTRDVGGALGIDHSSVARWLGGAKPRAKQLTALAAYLRVPVDVLLDDSKDLPKVSHLGPATAAALDEIGPGRKWKDLTKEEKGRLFGGAISENPQIPALLEEFAKLAPAVDRALEILRTLQGPKP